MGKVGRGLILVVALLALAGTVFWRSNPVVAGAERYAATVAASAGGVYLTLRSLNAFLSTAQELELGGSLVVSASAQPLKVLEPVDDTIERVAAMVFFVMVTTGIVAIGIGPASAMGFAMLGGALLLAVWRGHWARVLAWRLGWYGGFLGLALPLSLLTASVLSEWMTEEALQQHQEIVARITAQVDLPLPEDGETPVADSGRGVFAEFERYQTLAVGIYNEADALVASLIGILSVFVFRLLVLPGLILGAFLAATRILARAGP